ncbi:MAG: chorismate-binding protein, partial [Rhodothermales bacterium]
MVDQNDILISDEIVSEPARVRSVLAHRVRELLDQYPGKELHVARLVIPLQPLDPFAWLQAQALFPRVYWHGRDDDTATAAVGIADRCFGGSEASYGDLRAQLDVVLPKSDAHVRYFGGFRFDREALHSPEWEKFGTFTFVLPRFEYSVRGDHALLACNLLLPRDVERRDQILREIELLGFPDTALNGELPLPQSRVDRPGLDGWTQNVEWALHEFRDGRMKKIVLARRADFRFDERLDPMIILKRLEKATANCFRFAFQIERDSAFVGATPERLFRRSGRRVWTEAVAGTRPRSETPEEDTRLLRDLLGSEKDQREHAYVRES